jgi:hypothetical protein
MLRTRPLRHDTRYYTARIQVLYDFFGSLTSMYLSLVIGLQDCSACREIAYCCKDHQTEHFKEGHKFVCSARAKGPLSFGDCVEVISPTSLTVPNVKLTISSLLSIEQPQKASRYYTDKMWIAALPYYAAILVSPICWSLPRSCHCSSSLRLLMYH